MFIYRQLRGNIEDPYFLVGRDAVDCTLLLQLSINPVQQIERNFRGAWEHFNMLSCIASYSVPECSDLMFRGTYLDWLHSRRFDGACWWWEPCVEPLWLASCCSRSPQRLNLSLECGECRSQDFWALKCAQEPGLSNAPLFNAFSSMLMANGLMVTDVELAAVVPLSKVPRLLW